MKAVTSKLFMGMLGIFVSTAVSAAQVDFDKLQCAPLQKNTQASEPKCQEQSGKVILEQCRCPVGFVLVQLSTPGSIGIVPISGD
jgi:hypothetical protein